MVGRRRRRPGLSLAHRRRCGSVRFDSFRRTAAARGSFGTSARRPLSPTPQSKKFTSLGSQPKVLQRSAPRTSACACECRARASPTSRGRLSTAAAAQNICRKTGEAGVQLSKFYLSSRPRKRRGTGAARLFAIFANRKKYLEVLGAGLEHSVLELVGAAKSSPSRGHSTGTDRFFQ